MHAWLFRYYSFGLYAERLKENGDFTQGEIATIGYLLDLGVFGFRPLVGMLFDNFGVTPSFAACSAIGGTGYVTLNIYLSMNNRIWRYAYVCMDTHTHKHMCTHAHM